MQRSQVAAVSRTSHDASKDAKVLMCSTMACAIDPQTLGDADIIIAGICKYNYKYILGAFNDHICLNKYSCFCWLIFAQNICKFTQTHDVKKQTQENHKGPQKNNNKQTQKKPGRKMQTPTQKTQNTKKRLKRIENQNA